MFSRAFLATFSRAFLATFSRAFLIMHTAGTTSKCSTYTLQLESPTSPCATSSSSAGQLNQKETEPKHIHNLRAIRNRIHPLNFNRRVAYSFLNEVRPTDRLLLLLLLLLPPPPPPLLLLPLLAMTHIIAPCRSERDSIAPTGSRL